MSPIKLRQISPFSAQKHCGDISKNLRFFIKLADFRK